MLQLFNVLVLHWAAHALAWSSSVVGPGGDLCFLDRPDFSRAFLSDDAVSFGAVARGTKLRRFASAGRAKNGRASRFRFSGTRSKHIAIATADARRDRRQSSVRTDDRAT